MPRDERTTYALRSLGSRLAEIRRSRRLTQEALAEAADVDPQTIQRAETGRVSLSVPRLQILADALGVRLGDLFADADASIPDAPWTADEAAVVATWRRIPTERRRLALRVLDEFSGE